MQHDKGIFLGYPHGQHQWYFIIIIKNCFLDAVKLYVSHHNFGGKYEVYLCKCLYRRFKLALTSMVSKIFFAHEEENCG